MKLKPPKKKVQNPCLRIEVNNGKVFTKIVDIENHLAMFLAAVTGNKGDNLEAIKNSATQLVFAICASDEGYSKELAKILSEINEK